MATGPFSNMRFQHIETRAVMPNGKTIQRTISAPLGIDKDEYDRIDQAMVRAFGNDIRTVGTPLGCENVRAERPWYFEANPDQVD